MNADRKDYYIFIFLGIFPCLWGLFYEFSLFLAGGTCCIFLIRRLKKNRVLYLPTKSGVSLSLAAILLCSFITIFYALDSAMAFVGFLRLSTLALFYFSLLQLNREEKQKCFQMIPLSGAFMGVVSSAAWFFPALKGRFFQAERLGGFFQYSNTFALYLLAGLVILVFQPEMKKSGYALCAFLLAEIFMTGSRSVFLLTAASLIILTVFRRKRLLFLWVSFLLMMLTGLIFSYHTANFQNIGRYLSISTEASTLVGRLLYYRDGLFLLARHPFGLGYLGYFYLQRAIQTGVYTAKFIHNDFLQIALDFGIPALIAFGSAVFVSLTSARTSKLQKFLLALICIHAMVDFDLQY